MALRQPLGDLYEELGVGRDATRDEITAAYRARAKELHPDARPDDTSASERFARVGTAYRVLSDPEARARYDAARYDAARYDESRVSGRPPPVAPRPAPRSPVVAATTPVPPKPFRLSRRGARGAAWGGVALAVLGLVVGAFVLSLQRHDAALRANGVAAIATVIPAGNERVLEFETRSGRVVRATEEVKTGEAEPRLGSRVSIHYDRSDPTSIVTDDSHIGRNVTLWIVAVKLTIGGAVLAGFGVRRLRRV